MKKNYLFTLLGIVLVTFISSSCAKNPIVGIDDQEQGKTSSNIIFKNDQEKSFKNGYKIEDYTVFLTEKQQQSENEKNMFVNNNFFESDFTKQKNNIDLSKKINIITYVTQYSKAENSYTLGTFFINTSNTTIEKMSFNYSMKFKYNDKVVSEKVNFQDEDFVQLPPKGLIVQSIAGNMPPDLVDDFLKNETTDITFEITDLEINDEKVDNLNEH